MHLDPSYLFSNCQSLNIQSLVPLETADIVDISQENTTFFENADIGTQSLPQSINSKGTCGFDLYFGPQEAPTKSTAWTYSKIKDKLYVTKGVPCPINFSVTSPPPPGTVIRAMAIFSNPQHCQDIVRRCLNHSDPNDPANNGVSSPDHLIQCANMQSVYETNANSIRHSVLVPYERPHAEVNYSTYIYKFMCWSSCVGGLNRRPIKVVFTLEKNGLCLGRRSLELKICACPGRDRKNDEKQMEKEQYQTSERIPMQSELELSKAYFSDSDSEPPRKKKKLLNSTNEHSYTIEVSNKKIYEILLVIKTALEVASALNPQLLSNFGSHWRKTFKKENSQGEAD